VNSTKVCVQLPAVTSKGSTCERSRWTALPMPEGIAGIRSKLHRHTTAEVEQIGGNYAGKRKR
jgi:hypothetical protein